MRSSASWPERSVMISSARRRAAARARSRTSPSLLDRQRGPREPGTDRRRGVGAGGAVGELELVAVGKRDLHRRGRVLRETLGRSCEPRTVRGRSEQPFASACYLAAPDRFRVLVRPPVREPARPSRRATGEGSGVPIGTANDAVSRWAPPALTRHGRDWRTCSNHAIQDESPARYRRRRERHGRPGRRRAR